MEIAGLLRLGGEGEIEQENYVLYLCNLSYSLTK